MIDFFHTRNAEWGNCRRIVRRKVHFKFQKAIWHSCMKYGWPSLESGEHPIEWYEFFVLSFRIGGRGVSWQFHPRKSYRRAREC